MFMADDPTTGIEELGALDVAELYDEGKAMLIDVRTPMEYAYEHVRGALNLPMAFLDPDKLPRETDKVMIFHCGSGIRSKIVAEKCLAAGFPVVRHMAGGFMAWRKAKLPYVATNPATGGPIDKRDT